jgi:hypothetical protein
MESVMSLSVESFEAFDPMLHRNEGGICPTCDQVIPNDRLEQVKARQSQRQREAETQYAIRLKADREQLTAQLRQQNDVALARVRQEAQANEAAARAEEREAAIAEADAKVEAANTAMERARSQADELKSQLEASASDTNEKVTAARVEERRAASADADAKVKAASTAMEAARSQADELRARLEANAADTTKQVTEARDAARKEAEAALQPQLAAAQTTIQQALEQGRLLTEREKTARAQVAQLTQDVVAAREDGRKSADAELRLQLDVIGEEKQAAVAAKAAAEQEVQTLRDAHERALRDGIQEARDALEKSNRDAINAEQVRHFEEKQKFQNTVDDLKRQLENKTALELGEGPEVDLFDTLKEAFPDDDITRIRRGAPGADIRHVVRHNGKDCGLILYDSKNHKSWRNDFVTKLRDDQIADKADHAILSTYAFPQGTKQLRIQDRVILVNPARAVVIAELVRQQVVQVHCLNLSNDGREQKSLELYSFIMSERFGTLMTKLRATTDSLHQLDVSEQVSHNKTWQKRGQLIGSVAKAQADLRSEVERIVGTADDAVEDSLASMTGDTAATGA